MPVSAPPLIVVAGPTASGKSALAAALAERIGGVVVNADALQVYRELRILTARPTPDDEARAPHRLYGMLSVHETGSVARWRELALAAINDVGSRVPILVGGTGLYIEALLRGLAPVPPVPVDLRVAVRARLAAHGAAGLHAELARRDPLMAARLRPTDSQRVARAVEVLEATGRSLAEWQQQQGEPYAGPALIIRLDPGAADLAPRIAARFAAMLAAGALDEVRSLPDLPDGAPASRTLGLPELRAHLAGAISLTAAAERAVAATRSYAKRQRTWLRNRLPGNLLLSAALDAQQSERVATKIFPNIDEFLLTGQGSVDSFRAF